MIGVGLRPGARLHAVPRVHSRTHHGKEAQARAQERSLHLCFPMLSSQNGTQIRMMQSRFLKELPQTGYELYNVHAQQNAFGQSNFGSGSWSGYSKGRRGGYRNSF